MFARRRRSARCPSPTQAMGQDDETLRVNPDEVNGWAGKDVSFQIGERKIPSRRRIHPLLPRPTSISTRPPYDILRMKGVPLGKRNYLGQMRMKAA